jgi:hypothetical protein
LAVRNTAENFQLLGLGGKCTAFRSDVFSAVRGRFDTVVFAAPYHGAPATDWLERGVADPQYRSLRRFASGLRRRLAPQGVAYLGFGDSGDVGLLEDLLVQSGLATSAMWERRRHGFTAFLFELVPIAR